MAKYYVVATVEELPPGERKLIELSGRLIGVFNVAGEFFALRSRCPHQGGPLCDGRFSGRLESDRPGEYDYTPHNEILRCPWHGWEFDVRTGQSWWDPARTRVRNYPVSVEAEPDQSEASPGGLIKGPYVAETYPVSVEQQYVVVEV